MQPRERIIVNLNLSNVDLAIESVNKLSPHVGLFRISPEGIYSRMADMLLANYQADLYESLRNILRLRQTIPSQKVFLDLRFCDDWFAAKKASLAMASLRPNMFSVHELSGKDAIKTAVANRGSCQVCGFSASALMTEEECLSNFGTKPDAHIVHFADFLVKIRAQVVICSFKQSEILRSHKFFDNLLIACLMYPGRDLRTVRETIKIGVDYLIVDEFSVETLRMFAKEIALGLNDRKVLEEV